MTLSTDTLKESFFQLGGNISDFSDINKCVKEVDIEKRWGKTVTEEGYMTVMKLDYGVTEGVIY